MIRPTRQALAPVVTLLSPSPAASRRAQEIFGSVFGLQETQSSVSEDDALNARFASPLQSITWDSVASHCPASGALVHWLSVENNNASDEKAGSFSLLGVTTTTDTNSDSTAASIASARETLSAQFPSHLMSLRLRHFFQRPLTADTILSRHQGLPVLDFSLPITTTSTGSDSDKATATSDDTTYLKEVAFTMYDEATYEDGTTVRDHLAYLERPVTGVYQFPTPLGLALRPLPAAKQDIKGQPPVVLTFKCDDVQEKLSDMANAATTSTNIQYAKIGFRGNHTTQGGGQLRMLATRSSDKEQVNLLPGLDMRWCDNDKPTSVFHEAQEALLASSLPELQSSNVLKEGVDDERHGSSDCWVEVRSMVQNPRGFMPTITRTSGKPPKIATAPPSYPE